MQTFTDSKATPDPTSAQRAFRLSLATGVVMTLIAAAMIAYNLSIPIMTLSDVRLLAGLLAVSGFISAVLARLRQASLGVSFILGALYLSAALASLTIADIGFPVAAFTLILTFGIASAAFPRRLANRVNVVAAVSAVGFILLDLWQPPNRIPNPRPTETWALAAVLLSVYGFIILRQFRNYSLRAKLIIAFLGIPLAGTGFTTFLADRAVRGLLTDQAGSNLNSVAITQGQSVGNQLASEMSALLSLSLSQDLDTRLQIANGAYRGGDPDAIRASLETLDGRWRTAVAAGDFDDALIWTKLNDTTVRELTRFQQNFPQHVEVFYTDQYGGLVAATNVTSDFYQGDEEWWQAAYNNGQGGLYIGQPAFDESSQTYSVNMAIPIFSRLDESILFGVLRTTVDMESIRRSLEISSGGRISGVDLIFGDGSFFSGDDQQDESPPDPALIEQLRGAMETYWLTLYGNEESVVSAAPVTTSNPGSPIGAVVDGIGWVAVAHEDQATAFAPVNTVSRTIVLVGLAFILASSLLGYVVAEYLSRPILRLTQTAEQVAAGDLSAQAPVESEDEIGILARTFNATTGQLRDTIGSLEERVADRTRALSLSAEVSRRLSGILDQQQLVAEVVEQIRSAFNYYHVHIYLYDDKRTHLVLAGGTGDAARAMLARGHRLEEGRGLVGRAAGTNAPVLAPDVRKDPGWLPNPLLPETRSELAVPIALGARVLGVLDVQHNVVDGLGLEDQQTIQTIANQTAVALQNARSYAQAQGQAQRESLINTIGQKIQRATTIEDVLQIAAHELGRALRAERAEARIVRPIKPGAN